MGPQEPLLATNCRETETCMVRACHTPRQHFQNHSSFKAPWRVGDSVVGRENVGWTTSRSGHPGSYHYCSQGPASRRKDWKMISAESSLMSSRQHNRFMDWTELIERLSNPLARPEGTVNTQLLYLCLKASSGTGKNGVVQRPDLGLQKLLKCTPFMGSSVSGLHERRRFKFFVLFWGVVNCKGAASSLVLRMNLSSSVFVVLPDGWSRLLGLSVRWCALKFRRPLWRVGS